jgi:RND family efflux transporter MFP subunit
MSYRSLLLVFLSLGLLGAINGCRQAALPQDGSKLPVFAVSLPVQREVTDYVEYTGRTGAVQAEEVKARVTGFLVDPAADPIVGAITMGLIAPPAEGPFLAASALIGGRTDTTFKEGTEIKKDDVLFAIDPRPYQAQYDQAEAQVRLYESQLKLAKANYERDLDLFNRTKGAGVSKQALDADVAQQEQADAAVNAAKASLKVYKLNLDFCTVKSPIDGQVGRSNQPRGNLIMQDSTLLTTVQSVDPMYVYFDMDMPSYQKFQARMSKEPGAEIAVSMALQGEVGYPRPGTVNFLNNLVNPATDTLLVRGEFPNPNMAKKPGMIVRELKPGMFVRVQLPIGQPHQALLVIDQAITSIQGRKNLYVLDDKNTVKELPVTIGQLQSDGLRVVQGKGLDDKTRVVVSKLLQVRPKNQIEPVLQPMPTYSGPPGVQPAPEKDK